MKLMVYVAWWLRKPSKNHKYVTVMGSSLAAITSEKIFMLLDRISSRYSSFHHPSMDYGLNIRRKKKTLERDIKLKHKRRKLRFAVFKTQNCVEMLFGENKKKKKLNMQKFMAMNRCFLVLKANLI